MAPKEIHFFLEDFPRLRMVRFLNYYLEFFKAASKEHLAVGEASVLYLSSSVAQMRIRRFNQCAKIIVMLRNPVDIVYSLHSQYLYTANENEKDFKKAFQLQHLRRQGLHIPSTCKEPQLLQYAEIARLGEQVERLLSVFPREQVKLILYDDFSSNTKQVYEEVLSFLEVPSDGREDFPRVNANKIIRFERLRMILEKPLALVSYAKMRINRLLGIHGPGIIKYLYRLNTKQVERKPLSPELRSDLSEEFKDDIQKLAQILDRDLSHWIS